MDEATSPQATDVIRLRVTDNPKRVGSKSWLRFALYADRMTVGQYIDAVQNQFGDVEAGRCLQDLQWDSDPNRAFICIERNGKAITLRRTPSMSYGRTRAPGPSRKFSPPGLGYTRTAASLPPWSQSNSSVKLDDGLLASYCENFLATEILLRDSGLSASRKVEEATLLTQSDDWTHGPSSADPPWRTVLAFMPRSAGSRSTRRCSRPGEPLSELSMSSRAIGPSSRYTRARF
jgi:hypothetical protein